MLKPKATPELVAEEANIVAEYSRLSEYWTFSVETSEQPGCCTLTWANGTKEALVNTAFATGNLRNCPGACTPDDLLLAIAGAHPDKLVATGPGVFGLCEARS